MRRELLGPLSRITNGRSLAAKMKSDGEEREREREREEGERGTRERGREASEEKGRRRPAAEQEALQVSEERAGWPRPGEVKPAITATDKNLGKMLFRSCLFARS